MSFPNNWLSLIKVPFSKEEKFTLFLVTAFPINLWAIIIGFRNFGSVAEENGIWDAIGVGAYLLLFALVESLLIYLLILVLSMFLPKRWRQDKSLALVSVLYLALTTGLILEQSRALIEFPREGFIWRSIKFIVNFLSSSPPLTIILAAAFAVAVVLAIFRFDRVHQAIIIGLEKITLLSVIYLILDLAAIVVVLIRNF